jgi:hypothetical protein
MSVQEQRRNLPQENRVRFENTDNQQRQRVPRKPVPNAVVLDEIYDEQIAEQENDYLPEENFETVQTDGCETSMYIFEEGDNDPDSQENVSQTWAFVNKSKNKDDSEKEKEKNKEKDKEKGNEKEANKNVINNTGTKKKHLVSNPPQMKYNVVEDLSKLRITLPFTEVVKIPQQRENILRLLDDPSGRMEVIVISPRQSQNTSTIKLRGKVPPFYISIENHDVALHNCLVDTGATNNIMPLAVMEALGMSCTKYYETGEIIYAIDSRQVPTYGEIKYFYAWITVAPHIITVFNIVVVDLPPAYGVVLGRDWSSMIGGYIMNDGSCMMFPDKYGAMIKVPREPRRSFSFKKKDNELVEDYIDVGIGNYAILDMEQIEDMENQDNYFKGYWRMSFDGACSSSGSGVGIVLINPENIVHPHAIRLEFACTNNEANMRL